MRSFLMLAVISLYFGFSLTCSAKEGFTTGIISFKENKGQVTDQYDHPRRDVLFYGETNSMGYYLKQGGISYQLFKPEPVKDHAMPSTITIYRVDISWPGADRKSKIIRGNSMAGTENYYTRAHSDGILNVKSYEYVLYQELYNRIDLKYYQKDGSLKYDYMVKPGGDHKQIQLKVDGAENIKLNKDGTITIKTPLGDIREGAPEVFQEGRRIAAGWKVNKGILSFDIQTYDHTKLLVIDPFIRSWATYYGGTGSDKILSVRPDNLGNLYVCGETSSPSSIAIATSGAFQTVYGGGTTDAFIAKLDTNGIRKWASYYGGSSAETGKTCNVSGNVVYMAGTTSSANFPVTAGAFQPTIGAGQDGFIAAFDTAGVRQWSTYYGGNGQDIVTHSTTDGNGNIYLTGYSNSTNAMASVGAHQLAPNGGTDGFLAKFSAAGLRIWASYYGGNASDYPRSIAIGVNNDLYIAGGTSSTSGIATTGSYKPITSPFTADVFLIKFDTNGVRQWGTYYDFTPSLNESTAHCIIDNNGDVVLGGNHYLSQVSIIPWGYLVKFTPGCALLWEKSNFPFRVEGVTINRVNNNIVLGASSKTAGSATPLAHQTALPASNNTAAFIAEYSTNGQKLWASYYGGYGYEDIFYDFSSDILGNIYAAGSANSVNMGTAGIHKSIGDGSDGMLVKFATGGCVLPTSAIAASSTTVCPGGSVTLNIPAIAGATYQWKKDGVDIPGATSQTFSATTGGIYTVFVENGGCVGASSDITIVGLNAPTANVAVFGSLTICDGGSVTMHVPNSATLSYQWLKDGLAIPGATNNSYAASTAGSYTIQVSNANCTTTSLPKVVTVLPSPGNIITPLTSLTFCYPGSAVLQIPTMTGFTYRWHFNGIDIPGAINTTYNATSSGSYGITISNGICSYEAIPVLVVQGQLNLISSTVTPTLCNGSASGAINANISGGISPYTYTWNTSASTSPTISGVLAGSHILTTVDAIGCTRMDTFVVGQGTAPMFSTPIAEICALTVDSLTGKNLVIWEKNGTLRSTAYNIYRETSVAGQFALIGTQPISQLSTFLDNTSIPEQQSYLYKITETDSCNNESPLSAFHKTIHLSSNVGINGEVNLAWNSYEGKTYSTHYIMRSDNGGPFTELAQVSASLNSYTDFSPTTGSKDYRIDIDIVTSCNPLKSTSYSRISSNKVTLLQNGLHNTTPNDFRVVPNPATSEVYIIGYDPAVVKITDALGRMVLQAANTTKVSVAHLASGVYIMILYDKNGIVYYYQKLVKK